MVKKRLRDKFLKISVSILTILPMAGFFYFPAAHNALASVDEELIQENIYQSDVPASFSINYSKGWYCEEFIDENTAGKVLVFANHENPGQINNENIPQDFLAYSALIMPKDMINFEELMEIKGELDKAASEKISYDAGKNKTINFYLLDKKSEQQDITWNVELPFAMAFLENEKYVYLFSVYSGIPSGVDGQVKEIEELKKSLGSFKFNEAEKLYLFENPKEI